MINFQAMSPKLEGWLIRWNIHYIGSNWFWYFNSPLGCNVEYDADMDLHDDAWAAREVPMGADASQSFLFQYRERWAPSGPPPGGAPKH